MDNFDFFEPLPSTIAEPLSPDELDLLGLIGALEQ